MTPYVSGTLTDVENVLTYKIEVFAYIDLGIHQESLNPFK